MNDTSTVVRFTGWVKGRAHANTPIEMTGYPLAHQVLTDVRVTGYFPSLADNKEVVFLFDSLHKDSFTIGSQITLTIEPTPVPVSGPAPTPLPAITSASVEGLEPGSVVQEEESVEEPVVTTPEKEPDVG